MDEIIAKTKQEIEKILQNEEEHQDKKIDFILINPDTNETMTIASNSCDSIIYFTPYTIDEQNKYVHVADWDFSFDQYFFRELERGYQIGYITDEVHYSLWNVMREYYPDDIEHKEGVQHYLQYCADNGITKEYLDKKINLDNPNMKKYLFDNYIEQEKILNIKFIGIDNWDRPVYKDKDGIIYKDINLGNGVLALTTSVNNDFYGEPDCSIDNNVKINIVQKLENEQQRSSHEQDR